LSKEYTF